MPGSLNYSYGNYSAPSDISGRSLDSGAKKVSFNKAVRVKQYPWKPEIDTNNAEHLTLPSNRFWFKVHRDKYDPPDVNSESDVKKYTWTEDKMECTNDSLAPIEEVEDYDLYSSNSRLNSTINNGYHGNKSQQNDLYSGDRGNKLNNQMNKPPVDGIYARKLDSNSNYYSGVLRSSEDSKNCYNYNGNNFSNLRVSNGSAYKGYTKILEETENNDDHFNDRTPLIHKSMRLPRMATRYDSPLRRSGRNFEPSDVSKTRQRSRSYDPVEESQFKLRKADKSVSTEDLNFNQGCRCFTNKFLTGSRDMATQCNGTLNRDKSSSPGIGSFFRTEKSDEERLNNFVSPTLSSKNFDLKDRFITSEKQTKVEFGNYIRPYETPGKSDLNSLENNMVKKKNDYINGKLKKSIENLNRIGNNRMQNTNGDLKHDSSKRYLQNVVSTRKPASRILKDDNQTKTVLDATTPGFLRDRKLPLRETNYNANRKYIKKHESASIQNYSGNENKSSHPVSKPDPTLSNAFHLKKPPSSNLKNKDLKPDSSKRYLQNLVDNSPFTNLRNNMDFKQDTSKKYSQSNGDNSMIDWTNSGFQLSPRPGSSPVSGSAYTVHKTSPLLMYIPGVSHHECPAIDDDRLSHLSDLSRSDLGSIIGKDNNFRRSYSMRDGKSKWNRWGK